jgi:2-iminobutanoate/2-iminopropanoate deaminase
MYSKSVQTDTAPAAVGPYSQGIISGGLMFVSGQLGLDPQTGQLTGSDLASQAARALENLGNILTAGGYVLTDVVAVDVYLTDMGGFTEFNTLYEGVFGSHKPARAVVEVSALPKGACVEIKCIAHKPLH